MRIENLIYGCFLGLVVSITAGFTWPNEEREAELSKLAWIDSNYERLSLEERIGQLFMIRAYSNKGEEHEKEIIELIEKHKIGGLCFFQGSPENQVELINKYQEKSDIPLMISMDAEWGLGMRFPNSVMNFPRNLNLGAIEDNTLIYQMGKAVAEQCKAVGVHVNFAPVVDVNNNPKNPVINNRSFGENKFNVAAKSYAFMQGLQDNGVIACAKHFPGHGDTDVDSHYDLPVINHSRSRIDSVELFPFKVLSYHGIKSMMVAHLNIPAIDSRKNTPTTLSYDNITGILKEDIEFEGLIFTDALDMKGVTKHFENGEVSARALEAGNDILLLPLDVPSAVESIKQYIKDGRISEERLEESVKKILAAKYDLGLHEKPKPLEKEKLELVLNKPEYKALKSRLIENSITLVRNDDQLLPIADINASTYGSLSLGSLKKTVFQKRLDSYAKVEHHHSGKEISQSQQDFLVTQLKDKDIVFLSLHDMSKYESKDFGITPSMISLIEKLNVHTRLVICVFGSPYSLKYFKDKYWIIESFDEDEMSQDLTAQAIFGAFSFKGKLPVSACPEFKYKHGIHGKYFGRLGYSIPERVGLNGERLVAIDTIIDEMIKEKAAPGCQILIAKEGKIVFHKSYGYHTYEKKRPSQPNDIYDLASITKIASATISLMKLKDYGQVNLFDPLEAYFQEMDTTNKAKLVLMDVLAHHAKLAGWIPFYKHTMTDHRFPKRMSKYYRQTKSDSFNIEVAKNIYLRSDYRDSIWLNIQNSELRSRDGYRYSDLGFYMVSELVNRLSGTSLNEFVEDKFYRPLGLRRTCYNPLERFAKFDIVPSEKDDYFRNQTLQGYVHDMGAAMMNGISGHAGLFSTAPELAVVMQMLLNGGYYGGRQYLDPTTIHEFTTRHPQSTRRGLGFDMKELNDSRKLNMSELASNNAYGHLGFTGTAAFVDPDYNLVYIFLSNRTYPSMNNYKFGRNEYRPRVQSVVYESILY